MQFFDLSGQANQPHIPPCMTLSELAEQNWVLAKIRVEYDCLNEQSGIQGQAVLRSNHNIDIEIEWMIQDSGTELLVLFKGIEVDTAIHTLAVVKGTQLIDHTGQKLSAAALSLWIDGVLLPMLPNIRRDIKAHLSLWDYVEYDV